ncbi:hypothetical protein PICMEDRAFT_133271 [Pichia membranifaciens NRRL Y-2026]|uniref:Uncharacterized protein n=1 Tax=Pichia membranifaciens NRRL Y-2026 TaxID=763406 RepID=A0A1E3NKH0_9ASCO|nr:hypothetical protein PICMEDRAFT_133271 [Pichia membranifaciens NRRL Y-2026]ODQ46642.1 hypothetical protein PICMEDRAFT_133271 [Pichia membranifaciens NRRL Y-2026]
MLMKPFHHLPLLYSPYLIHYKEFYPKNLKGSYVYLYSVYSINLETYSFLFLPFFIYYFNSIYYNHNSSHICIKFGVIIIIISPTET